MEKTILTAAVFVFSKKGFHRATMDEIALVADVSKGTLYNYFDNKSKLFETVVVEGVKDLKEDINRTIEKCKDTDANIVAVVLRRNIEYYLQFQELTHIVINEISNGIDEDTLKNIAMAKEEYFSFLSEILSKNIREEGGKIHDFNLITSGIMGMIDGMLRYYLRNNLLNSTIDWETMIGHVTHMINKVLY